MSLFPRSGMELREVRLVVHGWQFQRCQALKSQTSTPGSTNPPIIRPKPQIKLGILKNTEALGSCLSGAPAGFDTLRTFMRSSKPFLKLFGLEVSQRFVCFRCGDGLGFLMRILEAFGQGRLHGGRGRQTLNASLGLTKGPISAPGAEVSFASILQMHV